MQSEGVDLKTTVKTADVQSSEKQGIFTCHAYRQTDRWTEMSLNIQKIFFLGIIKHTETYLDICFDTEVCYITIY